MSNYDLYLNIPGIDGASTQADHLNELLTLDFDLDFQQVFTKDATTGDLTSDYVFAPLYIDIDPSQNALAPLYQDLLHGTTIASITLTLRSNGPNVQDFETITLHDVQVVGVSEQSGLATRLAFSFGAIDYATPEFNGLGDPTGKVTTFQNDFSKDGGGVQSVDPSEMDHASPVVVAGRRYFLDVPNTNTVKYDGGSTVPDHAGQFELTGFELDLVSLLDASHKVAQAELSPIFLDFANLPPDLAKLLADGDKQTLFPELTLFVAKDNAGTLANIETITLNDVSVAGYSQDDGGASRLGLSYRGIDIKYLTPDGTPEGKLVSEFSFDLDNSPPPHTTIGTPSGADMVLPDADSNNAVFLKIGALNGGSTNPNHPGAFDVLHFDFDFGFLFGPNNDPAGRTAAPLIVDLQPGMLANADLLNDLVAASHLGNLVLSVNRPVTGFEFEKIELTGARIISFEEQNGLATRVAFSYDDVAVTLSQLDGKGVLQSETFDSAKSTPNWPEFIDSIDARDFEAGFSSPGGTLATFLKIEGIIAGDSTDAGHSAKDGWLDAGDFELQLSHIVGLQLTEHLAVSPLVVDLAPISEGLSLLFKQANIGTYSDIDLDVVDSQGRTVQHIHLTDALIDHIDEGFGTMTRVSLAYANIQVDYTTYDINSVATTHSFTQDLTTLGSPIDFVEGDQTAQTPFATTQAAHVQISGIAGNSVDPGFANWFDVAHYQIGVDLNSSLTGSNFQVSHASFSPLIVDIDPGNTGLAELVSALAGGTGLGTIKLDIDDPASKTDVVETVTLTNAHVVGYGEQTGSTVRVAFDYDTIEISRDDGGSPVATGPLTHALPLQPIADDDFLDITPFAATNIHAFLKVDGVDGITGDSVAAGHKGQFDVDAYQFNLLSLADIETKIVDINAAPLTVYVRGDTSQLTNLVDKTNGVSIPHIELILAAAVNQSLLTYETITLDNVTILGLTDGDDNIAKMTLGYGAFRISVANIDSTGQLQTPEVSIDLKTNDFVVGGEGNDSLDGGGGNDTLYAKGGNDIVKGGAGNDRVIAGAGGGDDNYDGGDDEDIISFLSTTLGVTVDLTNHLAKGPEIGVDFIIDIENVTGGSGGDLIIGDAKANILDGDLGNDELRGMGGDDTLLAGFDNGAGDVSDGGDGIDTVRIDGTAVQNFAFDIDLNTGIDQYKNTYVSIENLIGGTNNDNFVGNADSNVLEGRGGNDVLDGRANADSLRGGLGNDTYVLGAEATGVDTVSDTGGADTITSLISRSLASYAGIENLILVGASDADADGDGGANTLTGNSGNNVLDGGLGADILFGGLGNDTYVLGNASDAVVDTGGAADLITSTISRSLASYGAIERLTLLAGHTNGTGNSLANLITGSTGRNILDGGVGNDTLKGLGGNDTLIGGKGRDTLTGGANNDFFVFNAPLSAANRDIVTDFNHVADTFRLENGVMRMLGHTGALAADFFFAGARAHDADDHIIYNRVTGALYYDSNGNASGGLTQLATLTNRPALQANDFVVI